MGGIFEFFWLVGAAALVVAVLSLFAAPYLLAGIVHDRNEEHQRRLLQEAELDRKLAIAEAAIAARARGESFVPPRDYDRSL
ncbi:MAG: hypothetical protein QOI38_1325 [Sphingomonadales bacterium]|jgi:Tfp pilus assembly protein FimT|nr:hypothetical protein [Sphingomonadales bacterium]